jgi:ribose 1,5-bisphosphokinase
MRAVEAGKPMERGAFVAVVGPSGAGKDSLIAYAAGRTAGLARPVRFVRRVVTRPADPASEDHDSLDEAAFAAMEAAGGFAVAWPAHGLRYGLPVSVDAQIASGEVVVANVSRGALGAIAARYAGLIVANVVASPDVLARRLGARGRETPQQIAERLARGERRADHGALVLDIRNDGPIEQAGEAFLSVISRAVDLALEADRVTRPRSRRPR